MTKKYSKDNVIYRLLESSSTLLDKIIGTRKYLFIKLVSGMLFLLVAVKFRMLFFTCLLIGIGAFSMVYQRYFKYSYYIGFELCMMATVLTSLAYGSHVGAFAGFFSILLGFAISGYFKPTSFISVLTLPLIGLIVPFFAELPLLYLGLLMTAIYDAIILPLYLLTGSRIFSSILFFITHIFLNYWVFSTLAPVIYSLMV